MRCNSSFFRCIAIAVCFAFFLSGCAPFAGKSGAGSGAESSTNSSTNSGAESSDASGSESGEMPRIVTTISDEEFRFYEACVRKDYKGTEELEERTKAFANEVYAEFALGEQLGLCKPYSYESLKLDQVSENKQRQADHLAGEVVYGPLEYELDEFLEYTRTNLKNQIVNVIAERAAAENVDAENADVENAAVENAIAENAEKDLVERAREYWEDNKESFRELSSVVYRVNGEEKTAGREAFPTMEKADSELFYYLQNGEEGVSYSLSEHAQATVEIVEKVYQQLDFERDSFVVLKDFVANVYYPELLEGARRNFLLEFGSL